MNLNELKQIMTIHSEMKFSYREDMYDFQKDPAEGSRIKISVWRAGDNPECVYSVIIFKGEHFVDEIINAKNFLDDKSIAEAQVEIEL